MGKLKIFLSNRYNYHVLWLPPYHPDLNPIEEAWGVTKGHVALENDGSSFSGVRTLITQGLAKANPCWPKLIRRCMENERKYILQDKIQLSPDADESMIIDIEYDTEDDDNWEECNAEEFEYELQDELDEFE